MTVFNNEKQLNKYFINAKLQNYPILIDVFLKNKIELDVDGISTGKKVKIFPIIQHLEKAGIHSGDSALFIPSVINNKIKKNIIKKSKIIGKQFKIVGFFNIQYAINLKTKKIYVIEINPRASRTIPFLIKSIKIDIMTQGLNCILKQNYHFKKIFINKYFFKAAVFSFIKFKKSDPILGPEMKSTGEIISIGKNIYSSYIKSQIALGFNKIEKIIIYNNVYLKLAKLLIKTKLKILVPKKLFIKNFYYIKKKDIIKKINKNTVLFISNKNRKKEIKIRIKAKETKVFFYTTLESSKLFLKSYIKCKK